MQEKFVDLGELIELFREAERQSDAHNKSRAAHARRQARAAEMQGKRSESER